MQKFREISHLKNVRVLAAINGLELFGHERGNIEVFKALREMGAEVQIGVNAKEHGGAVGEHLRQLGFTVFSLPFGNQWSWQWLKRYPASVFEKARQVWQCSRLFTKQIRKFQPTHIHLGSSLAYSYLALALARNKVPLIYRMGDAPPFDSAFNLRFWRMAAKRASRVVAISHYVKLQAQNGGVEREKISIIYNLAPTGSASNDLENVGSAANEVVPVLYVGAVAEHKGVMLLVDAFAQSVKTFPNLCLWIVGQSAHDTEFRGKIQAKVEELGLASKVLFAGHSKNPRFWYSRAAVHVAPSICEEALGNVVLEAKRERVASIVFPSGGLPEMVQHEVDGFICKEKSADSLVSALHWMLADKDRLKKMGEAAFQEHEARFGKARFLQEWAQVYRCPKNIKEDSLCV